LSYASQLINRLSSSVIGGKTPDGGLVQESYSRLWYAQDIWMFSLLPRQDKLDPRARKVRLWGFKI